MRRPTKEDLRYNLRWTWNTPLREKVKDAEPEAFRAARGSVFGVETAPSAWANAARADLASYLEADATWGDAEVPMLRPRPIAYFSAEFGLHESLPIYSGGLGVLAGDHLKSASDLGVPLVAIGLLYREAYFQQRVDVQGVQHAENPITDWAKLPIREARDADGEPITVEVRTARETLRAKVWRLDVGRVALYLLDADVEGCDDRALTARLYGGDATTRIRQELLLGVGGVRALTALGIEPSVVHLNEGHSAFAALELVRHTQEEEGVDFAEACQRVRAKVVFTTHTPVAAGHDRFPPELTWETLSPLAEKLQQLAPEGAPDEAAILSLGRSSDDPEETFCMTVLALKMASRVNGVSALHGEVSRAMWQSHWPDRARHEVPIGHITNGVHVETWMGSAAAAVLDRHLPRDWRARQWDPECWRAAAEIGDDALITASDLQRAELVTFARERCAREAARRGESDAVVRAMERALDPAALTIGFARRFATYKRANLILRDLDLLLQLSGDAARPVQILFAGKAHPRDVPGQTMLREVFQATRHPRLLGRVLFLEDYDMEVGRALVAGADVWLNNPRRPHEASGTSGEKVIYNFGLNCSTLDGWWAEAYDGRNGFAIGTTSAHSDPEIQDQRDSAALAQVLPEFVSMFYDRRSEWCDMVRRSLVTLGPRFNSDRMVRDYVQTVYAPTALANVRSIGG